MFSAVQGMWRSSFGYDLEVDIQRVTAIGVVHSGLLGTLTKDAVGGLFLGQWRLLVDEGDVMRWTHVGTRDLCVWRRLPASDVASAQTIDRSVGGHLEGVT